jgi:hypothetical protein
MIGKIVVSRQPSVGSPQLAALSWQLSVGSIFCFAQFVLKSTFSPNGALSLARGNAPGIRNVPDNQSPNGAKSKAKHAAVKF